MQPRKFLTVRDPARLRAVIADRGFTYAYLARFADLRSRQFVHALATGAKSRCSPKIAKRLSEALKVPTDDLFVDSMSADSGQNPAVQRTPGVAA